MLTRTGFFLGVLFAVALPLAHPAYAEETLAEAQERLERARARVHESTFDAEFDCVILSKKVERHLGEPGGKQFEAAVYSFCYEEASLISANRYLDREEKGQPDPDAPFPPCVKTAQALNNVDIRLHKDPKYTTLLGRFRLLCAEPEAKARFASMSKLKRGSPKWISHCVELESMIGTLFDDPAAEARKLAARVRKSCGVISLAGAAKSNMNLLRSYLVLNSNKNRAIFGIYCAYLKQNLPILTSELPAHPWVLEIKEGFQEVCSDVPKQP